MTGTLLTDQVGRVAKPLKARGDTLAVTESSTGGLIAASLLAVPGASAYFLGGSVVYTLASRRELLRITAAEVAGLAPLTEAMAERFAARARVQLDATWAMAELGAAGPTGTPYGHGPGISVIAVTGPVTMTTTLETGSSDREANMWRFATAAIDLLDRALQAHNPG